MNPQLQLRDIHLPEGISWWPPAPGWWLVLLLMVALIACGFYVYRYRQQRLVHRAAQAELEKIRLSYAATNDAQRLVKSLSIWLRRVCLSLYPRIDVAGLTGKEWLDFLDQAFINKKQTARFSTGNASGLASAPYQQSIEIDAEAILELCHCWLQCLPPTRRKQT